MEKGALPVATNEEAAHFPAFLMIFLPLPHTVPLYN